MFHIKIRFAFYFVSLCILGLSSGSVVKNTPANTGDIGSILDQGDPLEKEMATHSSFLAWKIPWTQEPGRLESMGLQKSQT